MKISKLIDYGGNVVQTHNEKTVGETIFRDGSPYFYARYSMRAGDILQNKHELKSWTIFVLECTPTARWKLSTPADSSLANYIDVIETATTGDALQLEEGTLTHLSSLTLIAGAAICLVAGVKALPANQANKLTSSFKRSQELKYVSKPWGHETWINGEHPGYALKKICIKGPHRTSLQYHRFKQETNLLLSGAAKLHFHTEMKVGSQHEIGTQELDLSKIQSVELPPMTTIDVSPPIIHRVEAVSDIVLCETSTPHLDDVVRLSDDAKRPDGRINAEHTNTTTSEIGNH